MIKRPVILSGALLKKEVNILTFENIFTYVKIFLLDCKGNEKDSIIDM